MFGENWMAFQLTCPENILVFQFEMIDKILVN